MGDKALNTYPVALVGRVPVKVSSSSAAIKTGDYITSSSETGRAMRATHAGQMIGKALENWDPASGRDTVMVFVNTIYADPNNTLASLTLDADGNLVLPATRTPEAASNAAEEEVAALGGSVVNSQKSVVRKDLGWTLSDIVRRMTNLEENQSTQTATDSASLSATNSTRLSILEDNVETNTSDIANLESNFSSLNSHFSSRIASLEANLALLTSGSAILNNEAIEQFCRTWIGRPGC